MAARRGFGTFRRLPSKRWQAWYLEPDRKRYLAPDTYDLRTEGEARLATERRLLASGDWRPPQLRQPRMITFGAYTSTWLSAREPLTICRTGGGDGPHA